MKSKKFNCSPDLDEEVVLPSRECVHEICDQVRKKIVGRIFSIEEIISVLGYFICKRFRVDILHDSALGVEPNDLMINAYYDPDLDEDGEPSIQLVLINNPIDTHIIFDDKDFSRFVNQLADSLAHELIHMRQARTRGFIDVEHRSLDLSEGIEYLSNPDEIDAYAYNIATELKDTKSPIKALRNPSSISIEDSINLWSYVSAFSKDISHPVLKKLLKKVYKHLTTR